MNPRKLEHGVRMIRAVIPYTLLFQSMRITRFQLTGWYHRAIDLEP